MTDAAATAWAALLERFEHDLAHSDGPLAPWTPPQEPLPASLAERAETVLRRQLERLRSAAAELADVREQLGALRQVPPAGHRSPVYLDIDA